MSKKVPYELPDGDFVKYVEQSHQQALLHDNDEKEKALARLNASVTTDSPQDSLRKIREQHERTLKNLHTASQKNKNNGSSSMDMGARSTPNNTVTFPQPSAPQSASRSSWSYSRSSTIGTNRMGTSSATPPRGSTGGISNSNNQSTFDSPNLPPKNNVDRKLKKLTDMRSAFLMFTCFFIIVFFFGTEANVMEDADSRIFASLIFIFGFIVFVVQMNIWSRKRALNQ